MPINLKDYHPNWKEISKRIRDRADGSCELCPAEYGKPHWKTGSRVVLTVHHIDFDKMNNSDTNLIALCQRCHLRLDLEKHMKKAAETRARKLGLKCA
jgi:5-methylcytosine-specific restriction endonuclease McrA